MNSRAAYSIVQAGTRDARVFGNILTVTFYLVRYGCFVDDSDAKQFVHRAFLEASDHDYCVDHNSQSFKLVLQKSARMKCASEIHLQET